MPGEADGVRAANDRFYAALSRQSLVDMEQVWAHGPQVTCVHPGWTLLEGWDEIRESWRGIFAGAICLTVQPDALRVRLLGSAAIVTCRENITSFTLEGSSVGTAEATNIFERRDGRWLLVHHHASMTRAESAAGPA